ncbi:MAG: LCP family protein [Nocardioidaceae bacterium]
MTTATRTFLDRGSAGHGWLRRLRRWSLFAVLLGLLAVSVPEDVRPEAEFALIKVEGAEGVDAADKVVWILALGSDARPGQPVLRSRSDAIQLVGVNARTHHGVTIGIPRDSYVNIPGHGRDKINAAMVYGGPQATAQAVAGLTGIKPDYVFVTSFKGLIRMVSGIHGIRAKVTYAMSNDTNRFRPGMHEFKGTEALAFSRIRYGLPRGDFDRSMDQGQLLKGGLATALSKIQRPGFLERALGLMARYTDTNVNPVELYRLAHTVLAVNPGKVRVCVLPGGTGYAGSASVVFPDLGFVRSLSADVRRDATVDRGC